MNKYTKSNLETSLIPIKHAIACNSLVFLYYSSVWSELETFNMILDTSVGGKDQSEGLTSAINSLVDANFLSRDTAGYRLTHEGKALIDNIGLILMLFDGYAPLISKQSDIAQDKTNAIDYQSLQNGKAIANASILFGSIMLDPIVKKEVRKLSFEGILCDLGCGACTRLIDICKSLKVPGLGIEACLDVVLNAEEELYESKNTLVKCQHGDILSLKTTWPEVSVLMQFFVFHDLIHKENGAFLLRNIINSFPNLKYFVYVDIVRPSGSHPNPMPGYDYIHGLMNVKTRTYDETNNLFQEANLVVYKEIEVEGMPNTFIWILSTSIHNT